MADESASPVASRANICINRIPKGQVGGADDHDVAVTMRLTFNSRNLGTWRKLGDFLADTLEESEREELVDQFEAALAQFRTSSEAPSV